MKTPLGPDAYGYTIFCEDIRAELGGKLTYVGVFGDDIRFSGEFPVQIPRLALSIVYIQRKKLFVAPTKYFVFLPGDDEDKPSITVEIPVEYAETLQKNKDEEVASEEAVVTARTQLALSNLQLVMPGMIKVRVPRKNYLVRLGAVQISAQDPKAATSQVKTG